jgi:hypothetical protein
VFPISQLANLLHNLIFQFVWNIPHNNMSIPHNDILRVMHGNDHIQFRCDIHRLSRSRKHPIYILDTPSRLQPNPTLHIIGSSGNDYKVHVTPTSISCSCPDQHQACKHILFLVHQTMATFRRGKDLFIHPPTLIEKIKSGKTLQLKYLSPLANNLCVGTLNGNCQLCGLSLSKTITICSRCPNAHHTQCAGAIPPSCSCSDEPYKGLKSTITNGYRNYSTIFHHFSYPLREPKPILNRRPNQGRNVPLQPQNLFQPDNHRSMNFVPPSPSITNHKKECAYDGKPGYL